MRHIPSTSKEVFGHLLMPNINNYANNNANISYY